MRDMVTYIHQAWGHEGRIDRHRTALFYPDRNEHELEQLLILCFVTGVKKDRTVNANELCTKALPGSCWFKICVRVDCWRAKFVGNKQTNRYTHARSVLYVSTEVNWHQLQYWAVVDIKLYVLRHVVVRTVCFVILFTYFFLFLSLFHLCFFYGTRYTLL